MNRFDIQETPAETHHCVKCKQDKLKSEFQPNKRYRAGVTSWCNGCHNSWRRGRRAKNPKFGHLRKLVDGKYECTSCHEWKPVDQFHRSKTKCGRASYCKSCERHKAIAFRLEHPEKYREVKQKSAAKRAEYRKSFILRKLYGLTLDQYRVLLESQNYGCAICRATKEQNDKRRDLCVDHEHSTGRVRGLLCGNCNRGIGYFKEDPKRIQSAIDYLKKHGITE